MPFELYTAERERCAEDLSALTMRMGELDDALMLEADTSVESSRLEAVLEATRAEGERLEERLLQLEGAVGSQ